MKRGTSKPNVWRLVTAHRATYVDADGRPRWQDFVLLDGVPLASIGLTLLLGVELKRPLAVGLLTVSGLLAGLLFGVMLQVSARALDWAESAPNPSRETSRHAQYLQELSANAGYASLVCVLAAIVYVIAGVSSGVVLSISSAFGIGLGLHLVLSLFMVMKRVFLLTTERLNRARTGSGLEGQRDRRRAS